MTAAQDFKTVAQKYELEPVEKLREHPKNPHRADLATIAQSIDANGFYGVIVAQTSTGYILAGNHRYRVACQRGAKELPVLWLDVDEERALKILAVDNRSSSLGIDDDAALQALLSEFTDLSGSGYDIEDLQPLTAEQATGKRETVFEQSVQVTPNREYVLILAESREEWEQVRAALGLGTVRRGGYKPGSEFDAEGPARVCRASRLLELIGNGNRNSE